MRHRVIGLIIATAAIQGAVWATRAANILPRDLGFAITLATAWLAILLLGTIASKQITGLRTDLRLQQDRHQATLTQIEQLAALNEMLLTLGRSTDVGLAFQSLARHVGKLVQCDRLGLALLREGAQEVLTYSARVSEPERRRRPRPEVQFSLERSLFGQVMRSSEPRVVSDLTHETKDLHDAALLASQGFHSALVLPLISRNRPIGALMVISRRRAAFTTDQSVALQPLAEILAFAFVAQQQQHALEKFHMMEQMSQTTFALASEINGALQGVVGEASIMRRERPELAASLDSLIGHADRTIALLERMRAAAQERLTDADLTAAIPASPEAFGQDEGYV
jgi:transcriptional regulator with GAF, ATPase, and Fis domain